MKATSPRLSIVILAYNEERYLPGLLDSIAAQTVAPDEVIVVDNNSTDRSAEIAASYPFVRLVHEAEQGMIPARDRGLNEAKGPLIARIDADDVLPSTWVEHVHAVMDQHAAQVVAASGPAYVYDIAPQWLGRLMGRVVISWGFFGGSRLLLGHPTLFGSNMILTTAVWHKIQAETCRDSQAVHEDVDLSIHISRYGYIIYDGRLVLGVAKRGFVGESFAKRYWRLKIWLATARRHRHQADLP